MAKTGSKLVFDCVEIPKRHRSRSMRPTLSATSSNAGSSRSTNLTTPSVSPGPSSRVKREVVEQEDRAALFAQAEEEDVKPDLAALQDAAEHRRRVRDTTFGSELGEDERNDQNKRRRIANAPSVMPKTDEDEEKLRTPKAEDAEAAETGDADESDDKKEVVECRKRKYGYDTHRMCVKGSVNFGCRGPGKAFVLTTGAFDTTHPEHQKVYTVYAGDRNPTDDEPWRPYGKYEYLWCGLANKDEFNNLGAEASLQTEVIDAFMEYLRGNEDKYSVGLFENVFVQLDPTDPALEDAWETRFDAPKPTQRAAIERSLRENNGLQIGYAVLVYAGPMLEEEIRDIVAAREERRAREAPWKVAVEQYEADLQIWKKAAKRAKAKGEAEPPKPERPQKPKKPKKAQRVQEETEDEEDEQEDYDEDDENGV
ncbi:hypothetical protein NBRC10513_004177 [Rhodotorula toruloides]